MKFEMRFRPGDDVRALVLLALGVLAGGSFYLHSRYQTAIEASYERTETLYGEIVANIRILREASNLRAVETQAKDDLSRVSRHSSLSVATADLLDNLHASARNFDTRIEQLQPGITQSETNALQATALTIRVSGTFRNILAFIEDLSHHSTLISVSDTEIALANSAGGNKAEPRLDATIHATLYRLSVPNNKETRVASAR